MSSNTAQSKEKPSSDDKKNTKRKAQASTGERSAKKLKVTGSL